MAIPLVSNLVSGVKGGLTAALEGVSDIGGAVLGSVKDIVVSTLKETGEFVTQGIEVPASIVKGSIDGVVEVAIRGWSALQEPIVPM